MGLKFFSRKPASETELVLDVGTECVKALFFEKSKEKTSVLGSSLEYYDRYTSFLTHQFEKEVINRAISKALEELKRQVGVKKNSLILGLPADIFVSRVISRSYKRKSEGVIEKEEKEKILNDVSIQGKKKLAQIYSAQKGILPQDLSIINLKILEAKIDGYPVPDIFGYDGENLDFRILADILPKYYLSSDRNTPGFFSPVSALEEAGFKISGIINEVWGLNRLLIQKPEGVYLDIGGEVTQIFIVRNGIFERINEFQSGANDFSKVLTERLGLQEPEARGLKHRYSSRDLSEDSRRIMRRFFEAISRNWFGELKKNLKDMSSGILPSEIFIFGGGAFQPEIEEILEEGDWRDVSFVARPEVKIISPTDLLDIDVEKKNLDSQSIPALLICYGKKIF